MRVIVIPNRHYPPPADALALGDVVLDSLAELRPAVVAGRVRPAGPPSSSPLSA
jgi:hypothetical protein